MVLLAIHLSNTLLLVAALTLTARFLSSAQPSAACIGRAASAGRSQD